jgi:hypothetical protein
LRAIFSSYALSIVFFNSPSSTISSISAASATSVTVASQVHATECASTDGVHFCFFLFAFQQLIASQVHAAECASTDGV